MTATAKQVWNEHSKSKQKAGLFRIRCNNIVAVAHYNHVPHRRIFLAYFSQFYTVFSIKFYTKSKKQDTIVLILPGYATSNKCIKLDHLCCSFADKCAKFCTVSCELFNATISDEMTPWYTDVLQVIATSANNITSTVYTPHSSLHNLPFWQLRWLYKDSAWLCVCLCAPVWPNDF